MAEGDDDLVIAAPLPDRCPCRYADPISIGTQPSAEALSALRAAEVSGRTLGSAAYLNWLATLLDRDPRLKPFSPKRKVEGLSSCRPCAQCPVLA